MPLDGEQAMTAGHEAAKETAAQNNLSAKLIRALPKDDELRIRLLRERWRADARR